MVSLSIPQSSPLANYLAHSDEIDSALRRCLKSGWYILGQEVASFEKEFAAYLGIAHAVGVANGTDALYLALRACDVAPCCPPPRSSTRPRPAAGRQPSPPSLPSNCAAQLQFSLTLTPLHLRWMLDDWKRPSRIIADVSRQLSRFICTDIPRI